MVGDPDDVAKALADLSKAGLTGIAISLVNYADELPFFCDEVLPRLERMGLREKRVSVIPPSVRPRGSRGPRSCEVLDSSSFAGTNGERFVACRNSASPASARRP